MKKLVLVFTGIIVLIIISLILFPELYYGSALGQKIVLRIEGEKPAFFYYSSSDAEKDTIYMEGVIYSNTYKDLERLFEHNADITTLSMVNVPGSIDDKINLKASLLLREKGINTWIPEHGRVASGGTDMFLAGLQRHTHTTAKLGVHSWREGKLDALEYPKEHFEHRKFIDYYSRINITEEFYWYTLEVASPDDIHWMTLDEMAMYNVTTYTFNSQKLLKLQQTLSSDAYRGRKAGENERAQNLVDSCFIKIGLESFNESYRDSFEFSRRGSSEKIAGVNIMGYIRGNKYPENYIVIGAHYDHLGVRNDVVYNGADDNASGTAAVIVLADYFRTNLPDHSIIFSAFDAEEMGLRGSRSFVSNPPVDLFNIQLNINLDMISHNPEHELYIVGTHYYPEFKPFTDLASKSSPLIVYYGHDDPDNRDKDYWMNSSDNGPFFRAGIPNITFSVEDHDDYHRPTDDFENTNPWFFVNTVDLIIKSIEIIDQNLNSL